MIRGMCRNCISCLACQESVIDWDEYDEIEATLMDEVWSNRKEAHSGRAYPLEENN